MTEQRRRHVVRGALLLFIAWSLWLPLADVLAYPDRLSVLPNLQTDASTYHAIGTALAETRSLDALPPRHPPGWVTMLGAVYLVTGPSFVAGKIVSWLALVFSTAACFVLARRVYTGSAAWVAAAVCASSPAMRGYVGTLQYEVVTAALMLTVLVLGVRTLDTADARTRLRRAALTGIAAGLLILTRETFAVIVPLVALWMGDRLRKTTSTRDAILITALVVAVAAAPAVAWSAVQSLRQHTLITISEKGPMVVELGNNPLANGTYNAPLVGIGEPTGLAFVRTHPGQWFVLAWRKVFYFWGVLRDGWNVPRPIAVWLWRDTTGLLPLELFDAIARGGWLLIMFLVSLWLLGPTGLRLWWGLPVAVLTLMLVHVAVLSSHRFAVPVLPIVFVLISGPVAAALARLANTLRAPAIAAATTVLVVVLVLMQFQSWPLAMFLRAVDLDGQSADNLEDPVSHTQVRFADAKRGERPVVLLTDQYLPRGRVRVDVTMRRSGHSTKPGPLARIALIELDGHVACAREITADLVAADRFTLVDTPCRVTRDTPATLAIFTLGNADLAIDGVDLIWTADPARPPLDRMLPM